MNVRLKSGMYFVVAMVALLASRPLAQAPLFTDALPVEEFAARRAKVFEAIGDGVAVLQGAAEYPAYVRFRQNSQFFYLTGVEVPRALVLLDGRTKTTTLFVSPRNERLERSEGPVLVPGDEAARLTGIPQVRERDAFADALKAAVTVGRTLHIPHRAESLGAATPQAAAAHATATEKDPWDGRPSRATQFIQKVTEAAPGVTVADLDPILDRLRLIKSPREIALVREATRLSGMAIAEAIRSARPGQRENDLEAVADYVFKQGGAQGFAYFALAAAGKNAHYPHYHGGEAELKSGDLVLGIHSARERDSRHRDRLREPVGVSADGARRHRAADGRDRPIRRAAARSWHELSRSAFASDLRSYELRVTSDEYEIPRIVG